MKVTGQSSLIAAQQLGMRRTNIEAKAASAAFFAELKKANTTATRTPNAPTTPSQAAPTQRANQISPMREAPLRASQSGAPVPPGSLLNILV